MVYFTADLHFVHPRVATKLRGFPSVEAHDDFIVERFSAVLTKNDKLFVLGDVALYESGLERVREIPGRKVLVLGNHDRAKASKYLESGFSDLHGALPYKGMLLTHVPVDAGCMRRWWANVHGHTHIGGAEDPFSRPASPGPKYANVGVEWNGYAPVPAEHVFDWCKPGA